VVVSLFGKKAKRFPVPDKDPAQVGSETVDLIRSSEGVWRQAVPDRGLQSASVSLCDGHNEAHKP